MSGAARDPPGTCRFRRRCDRNTRLATAMHIDCLSAAPGLHAGRLLLGLCVGRFLNVVIHRLPKMMEDGGQWRDAEWAQETMRRRASRSAACRAASRPARYNLVVPRSRCPSCGRRITALREHPAAELAGAARALRRRAGAASRRVTRWSRCSRGAGRLHRLALRLHRRPRSARLSSPGR